MSQTANPARLPIHLALDTLTLVDEMGLIPHLARIAEALDEHQGRGLHVNQVAVLQREGGDEPCLILAIIFEAPIEEKDVKMLWAMLRPTVWLHVGESIDRGAMTVRLGGRTSVGTDQYIIPRDLC